MDAENSNVCHTNKNKVILFTPPYKPSHKAQYLLANSAADPLMPIRLCYQVNPYKIVGHFCTMSCIQRIDGYYALLYKDEMLSICSNDSVEKNKPVLNPIIGYANVNYKQRVMTFDTNSFRRAYNIANFVANYLPRTAVLLQSVASYNRFIFANAITNIKFVSYENYNNIFNETNIKPITPETNNISIELLEAQEKRRKLSDYPVIEQFPAWDLDDRLDNLENILQIKIAIARSISKGVNCSMWEFYQYIASEGNLRL